MRRFITLALLSAVLCCGGLPAVSPLYAQGLDARMQKVLGKFVQTTGNSVMGVGSWVRGAGFDAATSDFDMRLVLSQGGTEAQQLARWQQARNQMANLIREEFGDQAGPVLQRTNLYAPNQLMHGVENAADAMERFQRLKTVPSLAHSGPVTPATTAKYAEGLYGSGAQTYVQGYEKATGRLFYNNNGKCVTGLSELAHLGESRVTYTAAGTANTAGQWADHALAELQSGRGDKVAKYLERLERDLTNSRSLSRLPLDEAYRSQLRSMQELLKKSPEKLGKVSDDVARMLLRGRAEAAILQGFENAGSLRRAYLRVMLDGVAARNKVGELVSKVMAKVPPGVNAQSTMNFIVFCIGTKAAAESAGRGDDPIEALSNVSGAVNPLKIIGPLKLIGPALLAEIMAEVIIQARANGFEMAAGFQGAWDLMQGIYSAWGRAAVDPDPRIKLTLADLVANYQDESKLGARVMTHAIRASTRDLGTANEQHDQGVAQTIFDQCWPTIRDAWLWERDLLTTEYLQLGSEVVHTPLLIYYTPLEPRAGQKITCEVRSADGKLGDRLGRMRQIVRSLYGKGAGLAVNYYWAPGGAPVGDRDWQHGFTFPKPGTYPVKVRMEVAPFTRMSKTEPRVMLTRVVPALVEIEVGEEKKPDAVTPDDETRPSLHVAREYDGPGEFRTIGPKPLRLTDPEDEHPFEEGVFYFPVPVACHSQVVLHPADASPAQVERLPKERLPGRQFFTVPVGVPYHLELLFTASCLDKISSAHPDRANDGFRVDAALAPPHIVLTVTHQLPGGEKTEKEVSGGVYTLDCTLKPGEKYDITAFVVFDYTTVTTPIAPLLKQQGPLTHNMKGVRHEIAVINVVGGK